MNPNPLNYASLEASKRLAEAGIVMETEAKYVVWSNDKIELCYTSEYYQAEKIKGVRVIPAPSMAEVWRALPDDNKQIVTLIEQFLSDTVDSWLHTDLFIETVKVMRDVNRLIDLKIWTVQRKEK